MQTAFYHGACIKLNLTPHPDISISSYFYPLPPLPLPLLLLQTLHLENEKSFHYLAPPALKYLGQKVITFGAAIQKPVVDTRY